MLLLAFTRREEFWPSGQATGYLWQRYSQNLRSSSSHMNQRQVQCIWPFRLLLRVLILAFQKRTFARYWDHVDDPRDISSVSRFLSGGIGGLTSQLSELLSFG